MFESEKSVQDNLPEKEAASTGNSAASDIKVHTCMAVRPGETCPVCGKGFMNYNGLLILSCTACGYQEPGGGFT